MLSMGRLTTFPNTNAGDTVYLDLTSSSYAHSFAGADAGGLMHFFDREIYVLFAMGFYFSISSMCDT